MIEIGIIERSESPYCSPVIIVKKKNNTRRFYIDFRVLNKITVFDAEPMPIMKQIFSKHAGYKVISKLDIKRVLAKTFIRAVYTFSNSPFFSFVWLQQKLVALGLCGNCFKTCQTLKIL